MFNWLRLSAGHYKIPAVSKPAPLAAIIQRGFTMRKLILIFFIFFTGCISKKENYIVGKWKTTKAIYHTTEGPLTIYERGDKGLTKEMLLNKHLSKLANEWPLNTFDSIWFKNKLENEFLRYDHSRLILKNDSTFFMESFGVIVPTVEPGWYYGDTLIGNWTFSNDRNLKLTIGARSIKRSFYYKVIKNTKDSLLISQTDENYNDPFLDFAFIHQ